MWSPEVCCRHIQCCRYLFSARFFPSLRLESKWNFHLKFIVFWCDSVDEIFNMSRASESTRPLAVWRDKKFSNLQHVSCDESLWRATWCCGKSSWKGCARCWNFHEFPYTFHVWVEWGEVKRVGEVRLLLASSSQLVDMEVVHDQRKHKLEPASPCFPALNPFQRASTDFQSTFVCRRSLPQHRSSRDFISNRPLVMWWRKIRAVRACDALKIKKECLMKRNLQISEKVRKFSRVKIEFFITRQTRINFSHPKLANRESRLTCSC